jgi:uncharacterized membrane protein
VSARAPAAAMPAWRKWLALALLALVVLFVVWFRSAPQPVAAIALFALPPLLLLAGVLRNNRVAVFLAGVFGLFWFSHGVMLAWDRPAERVLALIEIALALGIIVASSWPGLRARFNRPR